MNQIADNADITREAAARAPVKMIFGGRMIPVADWSPAGIDVVGLAYDGEVGSRLSFRLAFPFDGYDFLLSVEGELRGNERGRSQIAFVNVTPRQRDALAYIAGAFASGEIVSAGEVIAATGRRAEPARPAAAPTPKRRWRRIAGYAAVAIGGLAVLQFALAGAYQGLYVIDARSAVVSGDLVVLAAPVAGQLALLADGDRVARGDPLFEVAERPDAKTAVASPCDCRILRVTEADGTFVRPGQPVATLVQDSGRRYVAALVPPAAVMRLYPGARVKLEYLDGLVVETAIARIPPTLSANGFATTELVPVEVEPGRSLPPEAIGQPVAVRFDTFGRSWIGRLIASGQTAVASLFGQSLTAEAAQTQPPG